MGKIAFVFPGQGAQYPGMGKDLYIFSGAARALFDKLGSGIKNLCFNGSAEQLKDTLNAQPCLYGVDLACALALLEQGVTPEGVAGFSLGEIPALTFAKAFSPEEGFTFVNVRAKAMHEAAFKNPGEMYAVLRLEHSRVDELCGEMEGAFPANYNCPAQVVVAVLQKSVPAFTDKMGAAGAKLVKLAVSGAFHSPAMHAAAEEIQGYLQERAPLQPEIPVYSNVTARPYGDVPALLKAQVESPVRWQKTIEAMREDGFDTFIETGAGTVLCGLIKKIDPSARLYSVSDEKSLLRTAEELKHG